MWWPRSGWGDSSGVGCGGSCSAEQRKAHQDVSFIAGWYLKASDPHRDERRGTLRADESCEGGNDEAEFFLFFFYKVRTRLVEGQGLCKPSF